MSVAAKNLAGMIRTHGIILGTERYDACLRFYRDVLELPVWFGAAVPAVAGAGLGAGLKGAWLSRYERLASDAAAAPAARPRG